MLFRAAGGGNGLGAAFAGLSFSPEKRGKSGSVAAAVLVRPAPVHREGEEDIVVHKDVRVPDDS